MSTTDGRPSEPSIANLDKYRDEHCQHSKRQTSNENIDVLHCCNGNPLARRDKRTKTDTRFFAPSALSRQPAAKALSTFALTTRIHPENETANSLNSHRNSRIIEFLRSSGKFLRIYGPHHRL
jgi:hypothetical protein